MLYDRPHNAIEIIHLLQIILYYYYIISHFISLYFYFYQKINYQNYFNTPNERSHSTDCQVRALTRIKTKLFFQIHKPNKQQIYQQLYRGIFGSFIGTSSCQVSVIKLNKTNPYQNTYTNLMHYSITVCIERT